LVPIKVPRQLAERGDIMACSGHNGLCAIVGRREMNDTIDDHHDRAGPPNDDDDR